jgi:branched-chain amino acid transport system permease protein
MIRTAGVAACLATLIVIGWVADNYVLRLATTVGMYAALALSWNIIGGFAGYPSFSTAAFFLDQQSWLASCGEGVVV